MDSEPNLKYLFGEPQDEQSIDVASVVARSRARRLPRLLGVVGVSVLAITGIGYVSVTGLNNAAISSSSDGAEAGEPMLDSGDASSAETFSSKRAPAEKINLCTGTVAEPVASQLGLALSVSFPDASVGATSVQGTVTLTNSSDALVTGQTSTVPAITLAQNGVVLWHTNGPMDAMAREVRLAPGESVVYDATLVPVVCGVEDDAAESFRTDLPPAPAGEYQVSAALDFYSEALTDLVTSQPQTITLH